MSILFIAQKIFIQQMLAQSTLAKFMVIKTFSEFQNWWWFMSCHDTHSPLYKLPLQVKSIGVRTGKKSWHWIDTKSAVSHSINKNLGFLIQTAYKWKKILISVLQELFINKDRQLRRSQNKTWVTWKHLKGNKEEDTVLQKEHCFTWMGCCSRAQRIWGTQLTSIA